MAHSCKYILICLSSLLILGCSADTTNVTVSQIHWDKSLGKNHTTDDAAAFSRIDSWWELLHSKELNGLIAQALANSEDVQANKEAFLSQIEMDTQVESVLFPRVDAKLGAARKRQLKYDHPSDDEKAAINAVNGAASQPANGTDKAIIGGMQHQISGIQDQMGGMQHGDTTLTGGITVSYQVDLFGANRAKIKAAELGVLISLEAWKKSFITTATSVTNNWLTMQLLLQQEHIMLKQWQIAKNSEQLAELAYQAGGIDAQALLNAKNQTADIREKINDLQTQKTAIDLQIRVAIGKPESKIEYGNYNFNTQLPITAGIPASMLKQSPDIRMALASVRIADQNVAGAEAARFPQLGLTATLGTGSDALNKFLKPESLFWQLGANLTMPLFDAGALKAAVAQKKHLLQKSVHQYREALFGTFSQVKINLSQLAIANRNLRSLRTKEKNIQTQLALKKLGFRNGKVRASELLMEQNTLYTIEEQILAKKQARLKNQVAFYSVLANHWTQNYAKEIVADWESPKIDEKGNN